MAVRYDQKTKDEVIAFIEKYNKDNRRGGQSAAVEKFKVSPITIANWLKKAGVKKGGKAKAAAPAKRAGGRPKKAAPAVSSVGEVLQRMGAIQKEIDALQAEFNALKSKL